jgi:hypothetical protein
MISTILPCDRCKKIDITGIDPDSKERLCPICYAVKLNMKSSEIVDHRTVRLAMKATFMQQAETQIPMLLPLKDMLKKYK